MATRASLLGVFATHALLMAFTLRMRVSSALRQQEGRLAQGAGFGAEADRTRRVGSGFLDGED